jgi:hypothetical protein
MTADGRKVVILGTGGRRAVRGTEPFPRKSWELKGF